MKNILFSEYEQILIGNKEDFSPHFFDSKKSKKELEDIALKIFDYAIDNYLHLSPRDALDGLNLDIVKKMKLDLVLPYISFPIEFSPDEDFVYILSLLYPKYYSITEEFRVQTYYNRVLRDNGRFYKAYFGSEDGKKRACICLRFILNQKYQFIPTPELYQGFAGSRNLYVGSKKFLEEYRLDHACHYFYPSKLDFLHDALPENQKDDLLYYYHSFQAQKSGTTKDLRKASFVIASSIPDKIKDRKQIPLSKLNR